jgi:hypothetical protein
LKPTLVPLEKATSSDDFKKVVRDYIDQNLPMFVMVKLPDGNWEHSVWLPRPIHVYELVGAMQDTNGALFEEFSEE